MTASLDRAVEAGYPALMHALVNGSSNPDALRAAFTAALPHLGVDREALRELTEVWLLRVHPNAPGGYNEGRAQAYQSAVEDLLHLIETNQEKS